MLCDEPALPGQSNSLPWWSDRTLDRGEARGVISPCSRKTFHSLHRKRLPMGWKAVAGGRVGNPEGGQQTTRGGRLRGQG